jgi:spore coat protein H
MVDLLPLYKPSLFVSYWIALTSLLLFDHQLIAQLNLENAGPTSEINNRFDFEISDFSLDELLEVTGEKLTLKPKNVAFNGQPLKVKSCKTRGNTTLLFRRKSLSLSLDDPINFRGTSTKKLALNNLAMDQNYWRARLCFMLMEKIGIFPLKNQYTELVTNQRTQGTYLMIQKPEDYCRNIGSAILVRREGVRGLKIEYTDGATAKKSMKPLKQLKELCKQYAGKPLYDSLKQIIDFNAYSKWLAFNYLIMNGDYLDELFLFLNPETDRFQILPWDYDDVFASQPHEGQKRRDHMLGGQLLFSSEAPFDLVIAKDEYLYQLYLEGFKDVLKTISPEVLRNSFLQVFQELYPFFSDPEVMAQSQFDQSGMTNLELLKQDLNQHYQFLVDRRFSIETALMLDN